MKKSELYQIALLAVVTNNTIMPDVKLEVIEELLDKKETAVWLEKNEAKQEEQK